MSLYVGLYTQYQIQNTPPSWQCHYFHSLFYTVESTATLPLLAPQSGAHKGGAYRDFHPN